jgi:hypothetical protein
MAVICKVDHCRTLSSVAEPRGRPTDIVGQTRSVFIARTIADRPSTDIPNYIFYVARAMIIIRNFDLIVIIGALIPLFSVFDVHHNNILIFDVLCYFLLGCPGAWLRR